MLRAVTASQARSIEQRAVDSGVELAALMRAAGVAVASQVEALVPDGDIAIVTGPGNNGGDGWVAALELVRAGRDVTVYALRAPDQLTGLAADAARRAVDGGVDWTPATDAPARLRDAAVIVDALLGTGAEPVLREPVKSLCAAINETRAFVVAVDLPTGLDADGGGADDDAVAADVTVTFTQPKLGLMVYPGAELAGDVVVADIGIAADIAEVPGAPEVWTSEHYARLVHLPASDAHKNSRGRLLIVAGSRRFPGAAVLAARGAMRAGAGYVTVAVPEPAVKSVQAHLVAAPVVGLPSGRTGSFSTHAGSAVLDLAHDYDAVVLGPGITLADGAVATARRVIAGLTKPLLVDADGLNALVDAVELLDARTAPTLLTPHPGELGRLLATGARAVQDDRVSSAKKASAGGRVVLLKGAGTVVAQGDRALINASGTPGLASAGTGDVLSGIAGALLAQGLGPFDAAALAAFVHGRAGELAAQELTEICMNAEDLPGYIAPAFSELLYG